MSDIQIAGATYNDVPSILVPKVGGGFAEYTEGGGGGSLTPFVLRPDAELVQRWEYDKLIVADEGKTIPAYSTSATTLKATSNFANITLDYANYDYYARYSNMSIPVYSSDNSASGTPIYSETSGVFEVLNIPAGMITIDGVTSNDWPRGRLTEYFVLAYWDSSGKISLQQNSYGVYQTNTVPQVFSNTLTVKTPALAIRGNSTYFSSAAWALITDIRYQYVIELFRAPKGNLNVDGWGLQQNFLHIADCYNNGGKLT